MIFGCQIRDLSYCCHSVALSIWSHRDVDRFVRQPLWAHTAHTALVPRCNIQSVGTCRDIGLADRLRPRWATQMRGWPGLWFLLGKRWLESNWADSLWTMVDDHLQLELVYCGVRWPQSAQWAPTERVLIHRDDGVSCRPGRNCQTPLWSQMENSSQQTRKRKSKLFLYSWSFS